MKWYEARNLYGDPILYRAKSMSHAESIAFSRRWTQVRESDQEYDPDALRELGLMKHWRK